MLRDLNWLFNTSQLLKAAGGRGLAAGQELGGELRAAAASGLVRLGPRPGAARARAAPGDRRFRAAHPARQRLGEGELERESLDHHNVLSLHIEALLWAQPVPIELLLRTQLDLESGQSRVDETGLGRR